MVAPPKRPPSHARGGNAGAVRIIGGRWRGTRLPVPAQPGLRPTPDRVRETLFNWLDNAHPPALPGARVLDLFAGSGALGLEAVSRGAREAWLVERDPGAAQALRDSVQRLQVGDAVHVARADAMQWLQAPLHGRFDLVFLDPPFDAGAWPRVLPALAPWLADEAWLYLESPVDAGIDPGPGWRPHRTGDTREVRYALYRRAPGPAATLRPDPEAPPAGGAGHDANPDANPTA